MASSTAERAAPSAPLRRSLLTPWPAVVLGALLFANTLGNDFTYDDRGVILVNERVRDLGDWRAIWLSDWWRPRADSAEFAPDRDRLYRPLTLFSFAVNYAVHGLAPAGYHAVNVLLHAAVCGLVWCLARRLTGSAALATVASLLFAVHPVHVEAVANIVGRAEVLATLLVCAGLLVILPPAGLPGMRRTLLAAPLFLLALLAKESAISYVPVALLLWHARGAWRGWPRRMGALQAALLLLPLLVYFPLRFVALEQHLLRPEPNYVTMNPLVTAAPGERLLGVFTVLGHYVRLLLVPARLSSDYGLAIVDPRAGVAPHTLLGLAAAGAWLIGLAGYRRAAGPWRLVAVLCAMLLASYALISNTFLLIGVSLAERLLYWPSVHALTLAAVGLVAFWGRYCAPGGKLANRAGLLRIGAVALLAALALRTVTRNVDWADNYTLMAQDVRTWPQGVHLNKGMGLELLRVAARTADPRVREEQLRAADDFLARALVLDPSHTDALGLRARTLAALGDADAARRHARGALLLNPHNDDALAVLAQLGETGDAAASAARAAADSQPADAAAQLAAGRALFEAGQPALAFPYLERAVALAPDHVEALQLYGQALALQRREDEALAVLRRALALRPDDWSTHANLSWLLARRGAVQEAVRHAERAHQLQPDELRTQINLAEAYLLDGREAQALALLRRVLGRIEPAEPMHAIVAARIEEIERRP